LSEVPAAWRAAALAPPFAHGGPVGRARLKASESDFVVTERLGFGADGGEAHWLLKVEKRGCDTLAAARALARCAGVAPRDVGFAGLKDKVAVATQYFTMPARRGVAPPQGEAAAGVRVLEALPHSRKLRRGALAGNGFRIVLRDLEVDAGALDERLARIAAEGVPNYFGPQRFGRNGRNLDAVARFAAGERLPGGREPRAFVLSAARALIFNALLARRVADGSWARLLPGELVNLDGSGSFFAAEAIDAELAARLARFDVHPTGPLAGRGSGAGGVAGALESEVLAPFAALVDGLGAAGLRAQRRALRLRPEGLSAKQTDGALVLEFALPAGAYATVVVRELVTVADAPGEPDDD